MLGIVVEKCQEGKSKLAPTGMFLAIVIPARMRIADTFACILVIVEDWMIELSA